MNGYFSKSLARMDLGKENNWKVFSVIISKGSDKGQKQPSRRFMKKAFLKNFAIVTGKHLSWSLFLIKFIKKILQHILWIWRNIKSTWFEERLRTTAFLGTHWYSTNEILKFYHWDKMEVSTFSFSWFFRLYIILLRNLYIYARIITDFVDVWSSF